MTRCGKTIIPKKFSEKILDKSFLRATNIKLITPWGSTDADNKCNCGNSSD